jgi:hypothetical protein
MNKFDWSIEIWHQECERCLVVSCHNVMKMNQMTRYFVFRVCHQSRANKMKQFSIWEHSGRNCANVDRHK